MPFHIENRYSPAASSNNSINPIARFDTPPEIIVWEKIKTFFCSAHESEVQEYIKNICYPPAGTTREEVVNRFVELRTLTYSGYREYIQFGRHGENHFCILGADSEYVSNVGLLSSFKRLRAHLAGIQQPFR